MTIQAYTGEDCLSSSFPPSPNLFWSVLHKSNITILHSNLQQSLRLRLNIRTQIDRIPRIITRHHGQLARLIINQFIREPIPRQHLSHLLARGRVSRTDAFQIDRLQLSVGVADEVEEEEDGWVYVWWLHAWVGFEGAVGVQ